MVLEVKVPKKETSEQSKRDSKQSVEYDI